MSDINQTVQWIAVDWGTTHLRAWVISTDGHIIASLESGDGMSKLLPGTFEAALLSLAGSYLRHNGQTLVLCCGMVGARQGWAEADYLAVPCNPLENQRVLTVKTKDDRLDVRILYGLKQLSPADVMRGEETQIAGFMSQRPDYAGVICLPGTHTKWVIVSKGKILGFSTCMTGELFSLLSQQSVLKHSVDSNGWDEEAYISSVVSSSAHPESVGASLFSLRAEALIGRLESKTAKARLSGLLVGLELAAQKHNWLQSPVVLIGAPELTRHYATALQALGATVEQSEGAALTIAGLRSAYRVINEDNK